MPRAEFVDGQVSDMLSRGVRHLNADEIDQAEAIFNVVISACPDMPQALLLMGVTRLNQARVEDAKAFLAKALAASPGQPMVLFYLGNAHRLQGDLEAAATHYRAALAARPLFADAELALGSVLRSQGCFSEAEVVYRQVLRREAQSVPAIAGLGASLNGLERYEEAERALAPGLAAAADNAIAADIENSLGMAKLRQRRFAEALPHFEHAVALAPNLLAAEKGRATALEQLNRPERAATAYRRVLKQDPMDLQTHLLLDELLHRTGREAEMLRSYDDASRSRPTSPEPLAAKADQLMLLGRPAEAEACYTRALRLAPGHAGAHIGRGRALTALGDGPAAIAAFEAGQKACPDHPDLRAAFAYCLLGQKDCAKAQDLAERAVSGSPFSQAALAVLGLCYRANNDSREDALNGYEDFIQVFDLDPPDGYSDMATFHRDLGAHLGTLHGASSQFFSQTLRGGTRAPEEIFRYRHALRDSLKRRIAEALQRYIGSMKNDSNHPFLGRRKGAFGFSGSWSSRMFDGGFHVNHIHSGWISSAYYVDVPEVADDSVARQGWLKFGEPSADLGFKDAIRRAVQPVPGRLVLFPSYMWHGTIPFHSDQARTTIAFDAIPL